MKIKFEEMTSREVKDFIKRDGIVILPFGACEGHGEHLPINTDTKIAYQTSLDAAKKILDKIPIVVLPAIWFGYTINLIKKWPGTISVKPKILIDLLYEICRSLIDMNINKIIIFNAHGINPGLIDVAVRTVGDDFGVFAGVVNVFNLVDKEYINKKRKSKIGGINHGGEIETSIMLHLTDLVDMSYANKKDIMKSNLKYCPLDFASKKIKKLYLSTWYLEDSTDGVMGDSSCASKEFGEDIHNRNVNTLCEIIEEFHRINKKIGLKK